jgi:thiamine-phosphate pyrophosphorylase
MSINQLLTQITRFDSHTNSRGKTGKLPRVLVLSDPARDFDIDHQLARWPKSCVFIERTFGRPVTAKCKRGPLSIRLASCTPRQARANGLDGVHWPQKRAGFRCKSATKGLFETSSAHGGLALAKAARAGFDAILLSTAFKSQSPTATRPLGAIRLAQLCRAFPMASIYALGGINAQTVKKLRNTRIYGVALVSYTNFEN